MTFGIVDDTRWWTNKHGLWTWNCSVCEWYRTYISRWQHVECIVIFPVAQMIVNDWLENLLVAYGIRQIRCRYRMDWSEFILAGDADQLFILLSKNQIVRIALQCENEVPKYLPVAWPSTQMDSRRHTRPYSVQAVSCGSWFLAALTSWACTSNICAHSAVCRAFSLAALPVAGTWDAMVAVAWHGNVFSSHLVECVDANANGTSIDVATAAGYCAVWLVAICWTLADHLIACRRRELMPCNSQWAVSTETIEQELELCRQVNAKRTHQRPSHNGIRVMAQLRQVPVIGRQFRDKRCRHSQFIHKPLFAASDDKLVLDADKRTEIAKIQVQFAP